MGACCETNNEKRINRIDENKFKDSKMNEIDRYLNKASRSVCKIITKYKEGTGFLIKLYRNNNPFYCLMTNEHIIQKELRKK